jgi:hypothetical protein
MFIAPVRNQLQKQTTHCTGQARSDACKKSGMEMLLPYLTLGDLLRPTTSVKHVPATG